MLKNKYINNNNYANILPYDVVLLFFLVVVLLVVVNYYLFNYYYDDIANHDSNLKI